MIVFGIGYIAYIKFGFYNEIAEILQIDTKGRNEINDFIDDIICFLLFFRIWAWICEPSAWLRRGRTIWSIPCAS